MRKIVFLNALWLAACNSPDDMQMDAAIPDLAPRDLFTNHCLPVTPQTRLEEGPCSLAPPRGYCFVEFPEPAF